MGKNKLAKFEEMDRLKNVFQPVHSEVFRTDNPLKGTWHKDVFGNPNPLVLEVGCGKGEYAVGLARMYPEKNFIGIDIKGARMWTGAKQANELELHNVAFLRTHAEVLESMFAPDEVSEIWITFPDPQMAKRRKRLTGTRFLALYGKFLQKGGIIHLKTDSNFLYTYTSALIKTNGLKELVNTDDLYAAGLDDKILGIKTFYEQQWLSRGKKIKYIKFALDNTDALTEPDIEIEKDDYVSEARFMNGQTETQSNKKTI